MNDIDANVFQQEIDTLECLYKQVWELVIRSCEFDTDKELYDITLNIVTTIREFDKLLAELIKKHPTCRKTLKIGGQGIKAIAVSNKMRLTHNLELLRSMSYVKTVS